MESVLNYRKKLFECKKFEKFQNILDEMIIPENFDITNCILKIFFNPDNDKIKGFEIEPYKYLYEFIRCYAKSREIHNKNNIILLVHPFYPLLRHANFMVEKQDYFIKYLEYEKRIFNLLNGTENEIILFESPDCFVRYSYTLYDKYSSIKRIIFTEHLKGKLLEQEKNLINDFLYLNNLRIVGCYEDYCIKK